ncbi:uncharacterized protein LOC134853094 [Symsagittifera roscoffensis]|uniref:uncharacterized protein LOC134853094 n=1 Tax=Symsagittifera roscoffensis TaxID=84072 RepID=UPI00307B352F
MCEIGVFDLIKHCHPSTIHFLLRRPDSNFDIGVRNSFGQNALIVAATRKGSVAEKIIEHLLDFGCDYTQRDIFGRDLLFYSVIFGLDALACQLISSGEFDLFHRDKEGRTVLFHAVCNNSIKIVRHLCSLMSRHRMFKRLLSITDNCGNHPIGQAFSLGHRECYELLRKRQNDLSDENLKTSKSSSQSYSIQLPQIMKKPVGGLNLSSPLTKQEETPESEREIFARKGRFRPGELSYFNGPDDVKRSLSLLLNLQALNTLPMIVPQVSAEYSDPSRKSKDDFDAYEITLRRFKEEEVRRRKMLMNSGELSKSYASSRRDSRATTSRSTRRKVSTASKN